jgi:adenylate kinase family enzyme
MLILLNGAPGSGKSTLAQLYVDDHPLALNLDIDRIRGLLGRWQDDVTRAGLLARTLTLAMARIQGSTAHS